MPAGDGFGLNGTVRVLSECSDARVHPLARVLHTVHAGSCPGELNFHCHTVCSDGSLQPEQLAEQAIRLGLQHLAVTDHHSTAAYGVLKDVLEQASSGGAAVPTLWTGMEISCLLNGCLVHVLALGFEPEHPALEPYRQGQAVVGHELRIDAVQQRIHEAGGLALLAHPARYRRPFSELIERAAEAGLDGGEAFYDYGMQGQWQATPLVCDAIDAQLRHLGLLRSCGTDTHGLELRGR